MNKIASLFLITLLLISSCAILKPIKKKVVLLEWYNVENLFDTIDDPHTADNEFTPDGLKKWNTERYQKKLKELSNVIFSADSNIAPTFIGLAEVENYTVLKDLISQKKFKNTNYQIAHYETSDPRGIDVALIYNADIFRPIEQKQIAIFDKKGNKIRTREILYIKGIIGKDTLYFFLNHWKSRSGGVAKTEFKRILAAKTLRNSIDSILKIKPNANIISMGDFNDTPFDKSLNTVLNASNDSIFESPVELFNLNAYLSKKNIGTFSYKNKWYMLDNIIVSQNILDPKNKIHAEENAVVLKNKLDSYYNPKADDTIPKKTYGGKTYFGGVSDHFPIYLHLTYR